MVKRGKYLFANLLEIPVEVGIDFSFLLSPCGPFSQLFSRVFRAFVRWLRAGRAYAAPQPLNSTRRDFESQHADAG